MQEATGSQSAAGALKDYARAILDGNLAEVAIYGGGARLVGADDAGNKCAPFPRACRSHSQ